jgi:hypothetical protein
MSVEDLIKTCNLSLQKKGLDNDPKYKKRLKWEIEEILSKNKSNYFWNLYTSKTRYPQNQNNLLVCWLLEIVQDYNIDQEPKCEYGEYPDIDVDYLPIVQEYLKNIWSKETFGSEYVCNIGNYTTFGLKSALKDMARVHGESLEEINALTKTLEVKDDEGNVLTWDAAMRLYPDLKKYCELDDNHKLIAEAAKRLLHRNRGMGVHAAGLIIANAPLSDLVPLVKRKDGPQASSWVEGLHGQDLGPMGLVKFDLLVIANLLQIALCCELVKKRHGLDGICNKPGEPDWTDIPSWRDNPIALAMANKGDTKGIFQFDSEGIRSMVRSGGVNRFEDLVAYSALFRPGPLGMKMQERYIERKKGREKYSLHPLLKPILDKTYGVMVFQEDIMKILHAVGEIPLKDCEAVRKAISKKKIEGFIKYKEMFVLNGQKNLGCSESEIIHLWNQIESFAEYGFNKSHSVAYTYISSWLLYLKSHYPHEFYAATLSCETLSAKIKEYKMEAKLNDVEIKPLDISKSDVNFDLQGNVIYFGFSNIKGIGEAPAKRIVESQPYKSFEDFLTRFGADASVLKPLLGLRCFRDRDPITLWKFAEHFKDCAKKIEDKKKRYHAAMINYDVEFKELLPLEVRTLAQIDDGSENPFDNEDWRNLYNKDEEIEVKKEVLCEKDTPGATQRIVVKDIEVEGTGLVLQRETIKYYHSGKAKKTWNLWKELRKLWQRRRKSIERYKDIEKSALPTLLEFDANSFDIDTKLAKELCDPVACEVKYYGFAWIHDLERSPDYKGNLTFSDLKNDINAVVGPVELCVKKVNRKVSTKNKTLVYFQVIAEDATGQEGKITVWFEDWERWHKEFGWEKVEVEVDGKVEEKIKFDVGNLLRVRLQPPSGGFDSFTLEANQIGKWRNQKRYIDKSDDPRVFVMQKPPKQEEKFMSDEEAMEFFTDCTMEQ